MKHQRKLGIYGVRQANPSVDFKQDVSQEEFRVFKKMKVAVGESLLQNQLESLGDLSPGDHYLEVYEVMQSWSHMFA